jgi:thiol-disulfide isomerase/thioredoxin
MNNKTILLVYSNSCGHCKDFMPEWHKFKNDNTFLNKNNINVIDIESETYDNLIKLFTDLPVVVGVPSIYLLTNDNIKNYVSYDGERNSQSIKEFILKNNKQNGGNKTKKRKIFTKYKTKKIKKNKTSKCFGIF